VSRSAGEGVRHPVATVATAAPPPLAHGPEIRPTAGANPLRPSIGIQRAAADDLEDGTDDAELPTPWWSPETLAPSPAPVRLPSTSESLGAPAAATIQRSAAGASGQAPARTITPARVGLGSHVVSPGRSAPVAAPVQRTVAQATRPSPLPQPIGAGMRSTSSSAARSDAGSDPSGASAPGGGLGAAPVVQTIPAMATSGPAPAPQMPGGGQAVVQREEGSAPAAPVQAGAAAPSERDLDELAQALFGRIRGRLRSDLIHDREAKGLTFDNV
jgi:hypothetical protein